MPPTDISEKGLESLIVESLVNEAKYAQGDPNDYDRDHAVDLSKLLQFLNNTQKAEVERLGIAAEGPNRQRFLNRLQGEIAKRGVIDVLRHGVDHLASKVQLFYGTPSPGNVKAAELHAANVFSVTRQLRYSKDETQLALDLCLFINGLPIATFELKNRLTKQTVEDAVQQYKHPETKHRRIASVKVTYGCYASLVCRQSARTAHQHSEPLGWVEIQHPFHPLRGQSFPVLKKRPWGM